MLDQTTSSDTSSDAASDDNVVTLFRMLAEFDRVWQKIERDREQLEAALPEDDPGRNRTTWIEVGRLRCGSPEDVRQQAANLRIDPAPLVVRWQDLERQRVAARRRARLDRFDLADRMARSGYAEIRNQIACTPATSPKGIAAKIELVVAGLRDGPVGDERAIAESALRDVVALGR